ncbi:PDZ domain-containing protein [Oscillatoria sp. FACHB-1407]|uniref:S41 family peptidase n=1 Tax=Oscillatoria sp. FACHB-1407 TaxID=2692847 RepID=UPI001682EAF8|nr:S41 family peptidase [Oscillatoria sp. FACHB-1407]MBD2460145.1 PDZ domain-containing protein [Oscillatoria sp. FACHB-1407]
MTRQAGYYRFPTIHGDRVVFVCEDDLWSVPAAGGVASRLTANLGEVSRPYLSPDGSQLAFIGREEGHAEVYCLPAEGGVAQRLTFLGAQTSVVGWSRDGQSILFSSNSAQPFRRIFNLYAIDPQGGLPERLPYGLAHHIALGANGGVVLGRNTGDPARWKRYRGGTAGVLWIDPEGSGTFHKLLDLNGNLTAPMWVGDRIYFISDHEGIGNLYSCTPQGEDVQRHTDHSEYYARNASTDGSRIVYHAGAELFCFDPAIASTQKIEVEFHSPQVQRQRKFVEAGRYLEDYNLHPESHSTLITTRGKSFHFGNWEGAVLQLGQPDEGRYRLTRWLNDQKRFVTITDRAGIEALEIFNTDTDFPSERLDGLDLGRSIDLEVSPVADQVVLSNHRYELIWVDLETRQSRVLDRSPYYRIAGFCWSPDGQWVAYSCAETPQTFSIKLCHVQDGTVHRLTPPRFRDIEPNFDPEGKFLYFLSVREFNPVYDSIYFDLGFPLGMRPFLITLQKDTPSPFIPVPKPFRANGKNGSNGKSEAAKSEDSDASTDVPPEETGSDQPAPKTVTIDLDGIEHRIVGFPVPEGRYHQIIGVKGKVLFSSVPIQGSLDRRGWTSSEPEAKAVIDMYDFSEQKQDRVANDVTSFKVSKDGTLIYRSGNRLRVCAIAPLNGNGKGKEDHKPSRKTGWLDLKRIRSAVVPQQEWRQMFREIWRLQREQFWTADMSGVDWDHVYDRYTPWLEKVTTRSEFSDLIWEMQGELGTSHAYEMGGDYRKEPDYRLGFLGADFVYDAEQDVYRIEHIVRGDGWSDESDSPLNQVGLNLQEGDVLLAVAGRRVNRHRCPQELLVHQAHCEVTLTFASAESDASHTLTVKTLGDETQARYREWVEHNHRVVTEATDGRIGYVHIPDMGPKGYAEFHRYYLAEVHKPGLIVDVRYNGGGHVSQLILEKLARQRIGYDISRWGQPEPYPADSVLGPMVAIANEHAGSDGDIFSHCFKLMGVGTLIGKRTWGGVIGIFPRHTLVDHSVVTQPEYSFWFQDVGWGVENYGTDPDIEIDIAPHEWAQGKDPQLDKAIQLVLEQLEKNPVALPDFSDRPRLPLP